jgi:trigger factor
VNTETTDPIATEEEKQKLDLAVDIKEKSACERHITVTVPRSDIERYFAKQFDELVPHAEVPGFRTGRAPRQLVEKKFRKQLGDQVKGSILMDSLTQISESEEFSAISEPDLDFEQVNIPEEGDLTYEFNIEVRPEFDMPKWEGLSLERPEHEFTDADVDAEIAKLGSRFSDMVPVEDAVKAGDYLVCNVTSSDGDEVIAEEEELTIEVLPTLSLADCVVEGFDKLVIGSEADDTVTTKVTINEFSDNEALRGKEIDLSIEILDVKRVEQQASDELVAQLGMESADQLKEMIRSTLESRLQYAQREQIREQINKSLTESANWELPPDLLRRQSRRELDRSVIEMRSSGFSEQEIQARENLLRQNVLAKTESLLKEHFILERIAEDQDIEADTTDYDLEVTRIAMQQNDSPRRVRARLERSGQIDSLRNMIIERKVIEKITDKATFKATKYEIEGSSDTAAIDFFAAGGSDRAIPEAKYEGGEAEPIPGMDKVERD